MSDQGYFPSFQLQVNERHSQIRDKLVVPRAYVGYCSVVHACIPVCWFNVPEGSNTLLFTLSDRSTLTYVVPPGQYSATELADAIVIGTASQALRCLYNPQQDTFTFTFYVGIVSLEPSTLAFRMGFQNPPFGLTSDGAVDLAGHRVLRIKTNHAVAKLSGGTHELAYIPIDAPFGSVINYRNLNGFRAQLYDSKVEDLEVTFFFEDETPVDFRGAKWSVLLQYDFCNPDPEPPLLDSNTPELSLLSVEYEYDNRRRSGIQLQQLPSDGA